MKKAVQILLCFYVSFCFSQNETNIWYFGENAGLDFNSGMPVPLLDGVLNTQEGCATISSPTVAIPELRDFLEISGVGDISAAEGKSFEYDGARADYDRIDNEITLYWRAYKNNYRLVSTLFHEDTHAFQYNYGIAEAFVSTYDKDEIGSLTRAHIELGGYKTQLELGDLSVLDNSVYKTHVNHVKRSRL